MGGGRIDFHVHAFPKDLETRIAQFSAEFKEPFFERLMLPAKGKSLQGWVSEMEMLNHMDAAGIEKVVLQGWYWQNIETCKWHNRWMESLMRAHPDRIAVFASILPTLDPEVSTSEVRWALEHGFSGFGELHPGVQGFSFVDDAWLKLAEMLTEKRIPVLFHVTEPVGRHYEPRVETRFYELQQFIESHPDLPIILAHWGALLFVHRLNSFLRNRWSNVYYDTAASPLLYDNDVMKLALQFLPPDRILYGSDYPLKLYPKDPLQPEFTKFLAEIKSQVSDSSDWEKISRVNAITLLSAHR